MLAWRPRAAQTIQRPVVSCEPVPKSETSETSPSRGNAMMEDDYLMAVRSIP